MDQIANPQTKKIGQEMMASGLFHDEQQAIEIFKASLLALRDRLSQDEAQQLGRHLPLSLRDWYFEGWEQEHRQAQSVNKSEFLAEVAFHLKGYEDHSLSDLVPVAMTSILKLINGSDAEQIKQALPRSMRDIFNDRQSMD